MFCENCGKKIEEDEKFCPYCGAEFDRADDVKIVPEKSATRNKISFVRKKNKKILIVIVGIALIISLCLVWNLFSMVGMKKKLVQTGYLGEYDTVEIQDVLEWYAPNGEWGEGEKTNGDGYLVEYKAGDFILQFTLDEDEKGFCVTAMQDYGSSLAQASDIKWALDAIYEAYSLEYPDSGVIVNTSLENDTMQGHLGKIKKKPGKPAKNTFKNMDFAEFVGASEEKIKESGLQESEDFPGYYSALNDSITVMCEGGIVNTIEISGNTKSTPSFHGVRIGMEEGQGYQIMRELYSEETPGLFVNQESKEMVRCEVENGKISKITYIAMDSEFFGEYQDTQEIEKTPNMQEDLSEYIFPDSDKRYLTEDEVRRVEIDDLFIGRNEIFARYGYIFNDADLQQYFEATSWYRGTVTAEQFNSDAVFNDFEKKNVQLIKKVEDEINGLVQGDPEQQAVIDDVYSFLIGNTFHLKDTQMLLQFTSENEVVALGYYGTDPQIDRYCTYSVSARYEIYKDDIYEYMVYITIDGVEYYMRYFTDGSMDLTGDGEFQGWYER